MSLDAVNVTCVLSSVPVTNPLWHHLHILFTIFMFVSTLASLVTVFVLLSERMRKRTSNLLLAALISSDILYLTIQLVKRILHGNNQSFEHYEWIVRLNAVSNCTSAIATWLIVTLCCERAWMIAHPWDLESWTPAKLLVHCACVCVCCTLLTLHQHFNYVCLSIYDCADSGQVRRHCQALLDTLPHSTHTWPHTYMTILEVLYSVLVVHVPICIMCSSSVCLLRSLHLQHCLMLSAWRRRTNNKRVSPSKTAVTMISRHSPLPPIAGNPIWQRQMLASRQRQVSVRVTLIVVCFVVCNMPSALLIVFRATDPKLVDHSLWPMAVQISDHLLTIGKMVHFLLFCVCSTHFRHQAALLFQHRIVLIRRWWAWLQPLYQGLNATRRIMLATTNIAINQSTSRRLRHRLSTSQNAPVPATPSLFAHVAIELNELVVECEHAPVIVVEDMSFGELGGSWQASPISTGTRLYLDALNEASSNTNQLNLQIPNHQSALKSLSAGHLPSELSPCPEIQYYLSSLDLLL